MVRFFIFFIVILVGAVRGRIDAACARRHRPSLGPDALARISAGIITLFDARVAASGKILQSTVNGFAVSIEAGCNGIEAAIILIAAMLAFPAPWKHRVLGILAGLVAVQALNIVRVISLFYLGQWNLKAFEWAHLYLWQALIMLDVLVVWLIWIRMLAPPSSAGSPVPPSNDARAQQAAAS